MKYLITAVVEGGDVEDVAAFCDLIADMPVYDGPVSVEFIDFDKE